MAQAIAKEKALQIVCKDFRPCLENAYEWGFTVRNGAKHPQLLTPSGAVVATLPSTPSDSRSIPNTLAVIKRATGIDLRQAPTHKKTTSPSAPTVSSTPKHGVKSFFCVACGSDVRFETMGERMVHYRDDHPSPAEAFQAVIADMPPRRVFGPQDVFELAKTVADKATQEVDAFNTRNVTANLSTLVKSGKLYRHGRGKYCKTPVGEMVSSAPAPAPTPEPVAPQPPAPSAPTQSDPDELFAAIRNSDCTDPLYWEGVAEVARGLEKIRRAQEGHHA